MSLGLAGLCEYFHAEQNCFWIIWISLHSEHGSNASLIDEWNLSFPLAPVDLGVLNGQLGHDQNGLMIVGASDTTLMIFRRIGGLPGTARRHPQVLHQGGFMSRCWTSL